ncbi:MAG: O-antigen ligase family protein [Ottowia sp.]|nr:O-antigen ligase family protein [Ottowia sp.]
MTTHQAPARLERLLDAGAFALLALALVLPSGYSIGALMLLAAGLLRWPQFWRAWRGGSVRLGSMGVWAAAIAAMGLAWSMHIVDGGAILWNGWGVDRCLKYALVLLALPAFFHLCPGIRALRWGCWLGAAGAGLFALWQTLVQGMERAQGHTHVAIQFGNIALLLGAWSAAWALHARRSGVPLAQCAFGWLAAALGLTASVASGSRGGWLALPLLVLMLALFAAALRARPVRRAAPTLLVATAASLLLLALPPVQERMALALHEWQQAADGPAAANTSVGLRRAFWNLAWELGREHPLVGTGQLGYERAQEAAIEQGRMPTLATGYEHAHNEWLDVWAKRGLLGCAALALFYAVPAVLLRRRWRQALRCASPDTARATAALCGLMTVAGYLVFGMTQVMFAHNNGNLVYLFGVSLWLAASAPAGEGAA